MEGNNTLACNPISTRRRPTYSTPTLEKNTQPKGKKMNKRNLNKYPVQIHYIEEDGSENYFLAYNPDFGASACSATGATIPEAIANLANVRRDIIADLREKKQPIPTPSPNPFEQHTKRCSQNCHHVDDFVEYYNTVKCSIDKSYATIGSPCRHPFDEPLKHAVTALHNQRCTVSCASAHRMGDCVECQKDKKIRDTQHHCPYGSAQRKLKGKLDPITKYYLRIINRRLSLLSHQSALNIADEITVLAQRLQRTVDPEHEKHYHRETKTECAIRISSLAIKLLVHYIEPERD